MSDMADDEYEADPYEADPCEGPSEAGPSEAGPSEAGPSEAGPSEADPCNSDYDYNYDTIDECDNIYDISPSNYQELLLFDEKYKLEELNSIKRDEFIYTNVFNNYNIPTEILVDFNIGTMEEWNNTCKKFNSGQMAASFATIYICIFNNGTAYNSVVLMCNNIHPFVEQNEMAELTNLLHTAVIHN